MSRRLLLVCVLLFVSLPVPVSYADSGHVKRAPTKLWKAYPLVQTPDPVIATPARVPTTASIHAEHVPPVDPSLPSQPSLAVTVAVLTLVASTVAAFALMTLQTPGVAAGTRVPLAGRRRRLTEAREVTAPPPQVVLGPETEDEPPAAEPIEAVSLAGSEKELAAENGEVEVLRAKRRERGADDHAALMAKLKN
jgi:hypothetical protein